jgi:hypothetical protein
MGNEARESIGKYWSFNELPMRAKDWTHGAWAWQETTVLDWKFLPSIWARLDRARPGNTTTETASQGLSVGSKLVSRNELSPGRNADFGELLA